MGRNKRPPSPIPSASSSSEEEEEVEEPINKPITPNPNPTPTPTPTPTADEDEDDDDDEGEESGSQSESESEEEEPASEKKTQPIPKPPSGSESGSESESESESNSQAPKLVTPISSKPMAAATFPVGSHLEISDAEKTVKGIISRIWSLEDEIIILRGILEYRNNTGNLPMTGQNLENFHRFVAPSLSIDAAGTQLGDKIRRLKKKYDTAAARAGNHGEPQFPEIHDQAVYELSKKIWGGDNDGGIRSNQEDHAGTSNGGIVGDSMGDYPFLSQAVKEEQNPMAISAFQMMDVAKARVLEAQLKKQRLAEMKQLFHKMEALKEGFKLVMGGMENS